jgi:hypothetical protein
MRTSRLFGIVCPGLLFAFGGIALATIPDANGVFHACVDNKTGAVRLIDPTTDTCASKETSKSWDMIGPMGLPGPQGPAGPPGGLQFVDSTGKQLGFVVGVNLALRFDNATPVAVSVDLNGLTSGEVEFFFESADCTGTRLGGGGAAPTNSGGPIAPGFVIANSLYYLPPGMGQTVTIESYQWLNSDGSLGGCQQFVPYQILATPWVVSALPIFVPPIRVTGF